MAGIGEASAILGVAQLGLQLASTLVTIIGDYRDAAVNINRLRDEIHLTSIALQQLGVLASENRLLPGRGVLEATHLRERVRSVIWEIRTVVKRKGEEVLKVDEVRGKEIDVGYFVAWKWALWTKRQLEGPRGELDRLKGSMTLVFVTHMAILGTDGEREGYRVQIPGVKKSVDWAEEKYREEKGSEEGDLSRELAMIGPEEWREFLDWKERRRCGVKSESECGREEQVHVDEEPRPLTPLPDDRPPTDVTEYECRSLHPMAGQMRLEASRPFQQNRDDLLRTWAKLDVWYRKEIDDITFDLNTPRTLNWYVVGIKVIHQSLLRRLDRPPSVQVVWRGDPKPITVVEDRIQVPQCRWNPPETEAVTYSDPFPIDMPVADVVKQERLSDEQIIEKQLALYQQEG